MGTMNFFLILTAGIAGALVMALEIVGARVIGAFYGVSLFVWTSLIAVTLLALAAGYAAGGRFADRMRSPDAIFAWLAAAGACVLAVPWLKSGVLAATAPLGPRWGAFASALALFGPALALLGAVSPAIVRQVARDPQRLGAAVGALFGWSTLGSLAGTLLAGYVLLVHFSLTGILVACAATLLALAAAYFLVYRRAAWAAALLALPWLAAPGGGDVQAVLADGTRAQVVAAKSGFYGELRVVEYSYGSLRVREMLIDGLVQGAVDARTLQSTYETVYLMQALPLAHRPGGRRALVAGLGPGLVPKWMHQQGIATEAVEIDPAVLELARRHFGFPAALPVALEDARLFFAGRGPQYDYIVLDVFNGDTTPYHLLSREALAQIRARLAPGGVVAVNLVSSADGASAAPVLAMLERVFGAVRVYPLRAPGSPLANLVAIAGTAPLGEARLPERWLDDVHPLARAGVQRALAEARAFTAPPGMPLITDEHNPVDVHDAAVREALRRQILAGTASSILLGEPRRRAGSLP
jgi:spermidine synthase